MRFEFFVAARYLKAKRRQAVVGVVTTISVAGVAAGVAALIIALAITNGMRRDLQDRLLGSSAHVQLMQVRADGIRDWRPLLERLRKVPHVIAASPGLYEQVLVARGARDGGAMIEGILPKDEMTVSDLLKSATPGSVSALEPDSQSSDGSELPPIVLGRDLAETIGASVGESVTVISPQGELTPFGIIPKYVHFRLAGTFHSGLYQYDTEMGFVRLVDAQHLFDEPDLISVISFKVDDPNRALEIGQSHRAGRRQGLYDHQLDGAEPRAVPGAEAGAGGHLHHHRAHRDRGRAEHSDRADHDGDGEDARHCRADEFWRRAGPGAAHLSDAGTAHQPGGDRAGAGAGLPGRMGRRPLSHPALRLTCIPSTRCPSRRARWTG